LFRIGVDGFFYLHSIPLRHRPTVGRTPLDKGSARRRALYLTTQTLYETNIHTPGGIRIHDPSKRSAVYLRLRVRGHWIIIIIIIIIITLVQNVACLFLDLTSIRVLFRNFRNSSLFAATCKNSPSARRVSAADLLCKDVDILRKPVISLKWLLL
jgi:hypothetical protein